MGVAKAFIRRFPNEGHNDRTMFLLMSDDLDLDTETIYAFDVTQLDETLVLRPLGKRQTDEYKGCEASGILKRF